ncbi:MAG: hypothetical protein JNJ76_04360 [Candidatus Competibacter sp.]|nr:hypothetical protein [Candidatus Competibacter sp.]
MSEQRELGVGATTTFPTWAAGHLTSLKITNSTANGGEITVHAGARSEIVSVSGNEFKEIKRDWAGIMIAVANSGNTPLKVQTA